jgi:hypothetical protein
MLRKMAPRSDAEILADIKELAPRDEQERKRLTRCLEGLRAIAHGEKAPTAHGEKAPTPGEMKQRLRARLKKMQTVKAILVATEARRDLIEMYDEHLRVTESKLRTPVPPGGHQPDDIAACSVAEAHDLLQRSGRVRWARWHRLSRLFYEFATGKDRENLSQYLTMYTNGRIATTSIGTFITGPADTVTVRDSTVWITAGPKIRRPK